MTKFGIIKWKKNDIKLIVRKKKGSVKIIGTTWTLLRKIKINTIMYFHT